MSKTVSTMKQLRNAGLSQLEIAWRAGVLQTRTSRWASGRVGDCADALLQLPTSIGAAEGPAEQGA